MNELIQEDRDQSISRYTSADVWIDAAVWLCAVSQFMWMDCLQECQLPSNNLAQAKQFQPRRGNWTAANDSRPRVSFQHATGRVLEVRQSFFCVSYTPHSQHFSNTSDRFPALSAENPTRASAIFDWTLLKRRFVTWLLLPTLWNSVFDLKIFLRSFASYLFIHTS